MPALFPTRLCALLIPLLALPAALPAAIMTVNSTGNGDIRNAELTLREAILLGNGTLAFDDLTDQEKALIDGIPAAAQTDGVVFNIPATPARIRVLLTELPGITDTLRIDGRTQPGYSGNPVVELDGSGLSGATAFNGISFNAPNCILRGFVINRFLGSGVLVSPEASGTIIENNFIGTDLTGTSDQIVVDPGPPPTTVASENLAGITIINSNDNLIGGDTPGQRNVISGNRAQGIRIVGAGSTGNRVVGNTIGLDAAGTNALDNFFGIEILSAPGNFIGATSGGINLIGGSNNALGQRIGIQITGVGASGNLIVGNIIGTDLSATRSLGNFQHGINILDAPNNTIGVASGGGGNVIANNSENGVSISGLSATGNRVLINSIYDNGGIAIDLSGTDSPNGVTLNDAGDVDIGGNNLQNFPVIVTAEVQDGTLSGVARLDSRFVVATYDIRFFQNPVSDPFEYGEAKVFLGSVQVTTDALGHVEFPFSFPFDRHLGRFLSATATSTTFGNTSELAFIFILNNLGPSTEEIVQFILGINAPTPNDFNVNGTEPIDAADVVTNVNLGR